VRAWSLSLPQQEGATAADAGSAPSLLSVPQAVGTSSASLPQTALCIRQAIFDVPEEEAGGASQPPPSDPLVRAWRALLLAHALLAKVATPAAPAAVQHPAGPSTVGSQARPAPSVAALAPSARRAGGQASATLALLIGLGCLCTAAGDSGCRGNSLEQCTRGGGHLSPATTVEIASGPLDNRELTVETPTPATNELRTACLERLLETLVGIFVVGGIRPPPLDASPSDALVPVGLVLDGPSAAGHPALSVWHLAERLVAELDRSLPSPEAPLCPSGAPASASRSIVASAARGGLVRSRISLAYLNALFASAPRPTASGSGHGAVRSRGSGLSVEASRFFAECIRLGRLIDLVGSPVARPSLSAPSPLASDLSAQSSPMTSIDLERSAHADRLVWKARKRLELAGLDDQAVQGLPVDPSTADMADHHSEGSLLAPPKRLRGKRLADRRRGTYVPPSSSSPTSSPPLSATSVSSSSSSLATTAAGGTRRLMSRNQSTTSLPSLERRRSTDLLRASYHADATGQQLPSGVMTPGASLVGGHPILAVPSPLLKSPVPRPLPTLLDPQAIFANGGPAATAVATGVLVALVPVVGAASVDDAYESPSTRPVQSSPPSWLRTIRRQASSTLARVWQVTPPVLPVIVGSPSHGGGGDDDQADPRVTASALMSPPATYRDMAASPAPSVCPSLASDSTAPTTIAGSPPANEAPSAEAVLPGPTPRAIPWASVLPAIGFTPSSHDTLGGGVKDDDDGADEKAAGGGGGGFRRRGGVLRSFSPVPSRLKSAVRGSRP